MTALTGTAPQYVRSIASPSGAPAGRVRADVFAKSESELLALYENRDAPLSDLEMRSAERNFLARRYSLPADRVVALHQVHGDRAVEIRADQLAARAGPRDAANAEHAGIFYGEGDALFTGEPGVLLTIRTADCLPLFFDLSLDPGQADTQNPIPTTRTVVGIAHAGWRGLAAGIVSRTLAAALAELYGAADAAKIGAPRGRFRGRFFFGPCIGPAAYYVGEEVARRFTHKRRTPESDKYLLDLPANARLEIDRALQSHALAFGLDAKALARHCETLPDFEACTYQSNERYFSHRRGDRGRNLNTIVIEE
ncbi:MAG: laccase domain-containing protein [Leptospirales bacterium]|jgi:copper oxidase (laccase) domain-containing protein